MLINNTDKLKKIMVFNPQKSYYKFVALIRAKDYKNGLETPVLTNKEKQEVFVKQWLIDSEEALDKCLPDMLSVSKMFRCRLYMTIDRKSTVKTMMYVRNKLTECLDHFIMSPNASVSVRMLNKIVPSASSVKESSDGEKRIMFDIDTKDENILNKVIELCGEYYMETFETLNGYHVIANRKFDGNTVINELLKNNMTNDVELKYNSLVLVAMY